MHFSETRLGENRAARTLDQSGAPSTRYPMRAQISAVAGQLRDTGVDISRWIGDLEKFVSTCRTSDERHLPRSHTQ